MWVELLYDQKDTVGRLELGPALLGSSSDVCGDPGSMLLCLSFSVKASSHGTFSSNANPDVQGAAVSNSGDPEGEVKAAEPLGYRICQ